MELVWDEIQKNRNHSFVIEVICADVFEVRYCGSHMICHHHICSYTLHVNAYLATQDMFEMGPEEVIMFCTDCVLSEDEEPCDIPESVFGSDNDDISGGLNPSPQSGLHP